VKPNAPDFACKNKDGCGWKQWPPKAQTGYAQAMVPKQPLTERPAQLAGSEPMPWEGYAPDQKAVALFWDSFDNVLEGVARRKLTEMFKPENLCSLIATQYIQRSKV